MIGSVSTSKDFQKTLRYVGRSPSKRAYTNFSAGFGEDIKAMAEAMEAATALSDRCERPCYHFAISPAPGDDLSEDDWFRFTEDFLEDMGLADRQAIGWLHQDETYPDGTPRPHLHLVVNRIDGFGRAADTSWNYRQVDSVLRKLEGDYQLQPVQSAQESDIRRDTPGQVHRLAAEQAAYQNPEHPRSKPPQPSLRTQLQTAIDQALEADAPTPAAIANALANDGINTRMSDLGWSFEKDGIHLAGCQLGRRYSLKSVEQIMADPSPQQSTPERQQRQRQRRRSMKEIMQASQPTRQEHPDGKRQAAHLQRSGHSLAQQSEEVDGLTFIGGAVAGVGALAELGEGFRQSLQAARQQAESDRAAGQIDKLEEIGDRTSDLERTWLERSGNADIAEKTDSFEAPKLKDGSPTTNSITLANERLEGISDRLGIEFEEPEPIAIDPTAPTGQQLDQIDDAMAQLDERLSLLEQALEPENLQPGEREKDDITGAQIAESLANFSRARTHFRGETDPTPFSSSAGTVELSREGFQGRDSRLTIIDADYGTVFEATKAAEEDWKPLIDELPSEQVDTIAKLPQTAAAYGQYRRGQELVGTLQSLPQTADQFAGDRGQIQWDSQPSGFDYRFSIERQTDGTQQIVGQAAASGDTVFTATAQGDRVFVEQNAIPSQHTDELFTQREQELTPAEDSQGFTLGAQPQPSRQRELEL